jgi:hypothetical protein
MKRGVHGEFVLERCVESAWQPWALRTLAESFTLGRLNRMFLFRQHYRHHRWGSQALLTSRQAFGVLYHFDGQRELAFRIRRMAIEDIAYVRRQYNMKRPFLQA